MNSQSHIGSNSDLFSDHDDAESSCVSATTTQGISNFQIPAPAPTVRDVKGFSKCHGITDTTDNNNNLTGIKRLTLEDPMKKALFEKLLECPKCSNICIPPVFVCSSGHHICEECQRGMQNCWICTSEFNGGRCFFYENCFEKNTFKCKYLSDGCQETILGTEVKDHLQNCDYSRAVDCFRCKKEGIPYTNFLKHYTDSHKEDITSHEDGEFRCRYRQDFSESGTWQIKRAIEFDGHTFFPVARQDSVINPRIGIFLWIFGSETDAQKYDVQISLGSEMGTLAAKERPRPRYHWSGWEGPVVSIQQGSQEVLEAGICLFTSPAAIETAYGEQSDKYWFPTFKIIKLPVSTVDEDQYSLPISMTRLGMNGKCLIT